MLILIFFKLKIIFKISILNKKIKSNIVKDFINIVIDVTLLMLIKECDKIDSLNVVIIFLYNDSN